MKSKQITILLLSTFIIHCGYSQVLHTENFNVILDTTKTVKGSLTPNFRYRNLKEDYVEIENTTDISLRFKNHGITVANKLEYALFGNENLMSGGFLYCEYVTIQNKKIALEPYFQMHWQEARGLERKYAVGSNLRWRILVKRDIGIYGGIGGLFEYERWTYIGVADESEIPSNSTPVEVNRIRGATYLSLKKEFGSLFGLDMSVYYQPTISDPLHNYRLAGSFELTYNINRFLGLTLLYQNIYDSSPLVPIDNWFNDVNFGLTLSF